MGDTIDRESPDARRPLIFAQELGKAFTPGLPVLQDINLSLARGEFLALIGPSGCGKSTLLKLIAGLIEPSGGKLTVGGGAPAAAEDKLGFVFQDANLLPWLDITANVALPLRLAGVPRPQRERRAAEMLQLVGLGDATGRYPRELSGGMKMRVSIARALARQPELLLLDEPFGALDEMTRDTLNEELLRLRELQRWTGVFVTHSVAEAVFLASQVMVLSANPGRVHKMIDIDLPYPRTASLRAEERYHQHLAEVTRSLHSVEGAA
ncbi:ABC transporter ATP-binding protein [Haliea sp. E17]|uniref:ABC transporter ATP-binding protein n=1 Tax=Haliea sp. E17 TaxID=3401576 RepID=UPI003AB06D3B